MISTNTLKKLKKRGASVDELRDLLGRGRAKLGIFEGDLFEGELEIGQAASMIKHLQPVSEVMKELVEDYNTALRRIQDELKLELNKLIITFHYGR